MLTVCGVSLRLEHGEEEAGAVAEAMGLWGPATAATWPNGGPALTIQLLPHDALPCGRPISDVRVVHATRGKARLAWVEPERLAVSFHGDVDAHVLRRLVVIALLDHLSLRGLHCIHGAAVDLGDAIVAVVGPSGAGKSTISRALGGVVLSENYSLVDRDGRWRAFLDPYPLAGAVAARHDRRPLGALVELAPDEGAATPSAAAVERLGQLGEHSLGPQFRGALSRLDPGALQRVDAAHRAFTERLLRMRTVRVAFSHERCDPLDTARAIRAAVRA